jgi:AcrR family transcriptional regulator
MSARQQQKAETARRIFEAAVTLFREQGYGATTVDQIAQAAGVAKGTFFTHFASKDAVLDHIGALQLARIAARIAADPEFPGRDARAQLQIVAGALAAGLADQPAEMRALTTEILARRSLFEADRQGIGELDALMERIVAAGQARGEIRADAPAARLAAMARGAYFLAVFEWLKGPELDLPALVAQHLDLLLDGIARTETDRSRS